MYLGAQGTVRRASLRRSQGAGMERSEVVRSGREGGSA